MSTNIPENVARTDYHKSLVNAQLHRCHQGKVRDTYTLPDNDLLLIIATDRVSIFDFVLPFTIPLKGELLTAISVFWFDEVLTGTDHHMVAYGRGIDEYLPPKTKDREHLYRRGMVVKKQKMIPIECVVRGYLTGTGWKSYKQNQQVCGITLPPGLTDGSHITTGPIFTPTTKAEVGHDEHLPADKVVEQYGSWLREKSLSIYQEIAAVAQDKGFILADTKFEFGEGAILADEVATPDSSRYWDTEGWMSAQDKGRSPKPFDKDLLRQWGTGIALDRLNPENQKDLTLVQQLEPHPPTVVKTSALYQIVLKRLTGFELKEFQQKKFGVS